MGVSYGHKLFTTLARGFQTYGLNALKHVRAFLSHLFFQFRLFSSAKVVSYKSGTILELLQATTNIFLALVADLSMSVSYR
jgi:hypothetical protein